MQKAAGRRQAKGSDASRARLGEQLRLIRQGRGLTLRDVAERTGLAISTLSKVEHDQMSLTYDKLVQLAHGLEIGFAELFAPPEHPAMVTARRSITRNGDGVLQRTANYEYRYLCTELAAKRMVPIVTRIKSHTIQEFGPLVSHAGEEFIYVLEGAITVHTEFYEPVLLHRGDSIYLDSTMGHAYLAAGTEDALALGVCSSEESNFDKRLQAIVDSRSRGETAAEPVKLPRGSKRRSFGSDPAY
ncbi:transcriptional regulator with XRE-family HTH domain [Microvirga lupini]|uniref:Transcriptional regulator with XRE-family HTH domain n=1 Tax=Microvirga lupini TaxID=420324 RepID=A0A7W4VQC0_9HYPH|nr:XRE family transcriptional regulator [Microvirga lupini]MBB3020972.1 transcriptional regulator with XRE-family HTH domain [Microvirga lupini]